MKLSWKENREKPIPGFIGIAGKLTLVFIIAILLIGYVMKNVGMYIHTAEHAVSDIRGDYMLEQIIARLVDEETVERIFVRGREIYEGIPEERRKDPMDIEYLSSFDELEDEVYEDIWKILVEIKGIWQASWIDICFIDEETDRLVYLISTDEPGDGSYSTGYWEYRSELPNTIIDSDVDKIFNATDPKIMKIAFDLLDGGPEEDEQFTTLEPYHSKSTGKVIGYIAIGEMWDAYENELSEYELFFMVLIWLALLAVFIIGYLVVQVWIVKPIKRLIRATREYSANKEKDSDKRYFVNLKIGSHDEIKVLARSMAVMEEEIAEYMKNLMEITSEEERIRTELDVGSRIQIGILPTSLEDYNGKDDFAICAYMKPAKEVGGDLYDYFAIDDDHIGLTVADVSGKGVPAALFMMVTRTLIKNTAMTMESPAEVISLVNKRLSADNTELMFVTVWFAIYTVSTGRLAYVNAGHEFPYVYRVDRDAYELISEKGDIMLGCNPNWEFHEKEIVLNPGDKIFEYSDGIPEAVTQDNEMFDMDRMTDCMNKNKSLSGDDFLSAVKTEVDEFVAGADQFDDITMLLFERRGSV